MGDWKDFTKFPGSFADATTRNEVIKRIAELHSAGKTQLIYFQSEIFTENVVKMVINYSDVVGTDQNKHRNPATTWWNTYLVNVHFQQLFYALETYGDPDAFFKKLGWTKGWCHFAPRFRSISGNLRSMSGSFPVCNQ